MDKLTCIFLVLSLYLYPHTRDTDFGLWKHIN